MKTCNHFHFSVIHLEHAQSVQSVFSKNEEITPGTLKKWKKKGESFIKYIDNITALLLLIENKVVCHSLQSPFRGLPPPLCCEGNANDASGAKPRDCCCCNIPVLVAIAEVDLGESHRP